MRTAVKKRPGVIIFLVVVVVFAGVGFWFNFCQQDPVPSGEPTFDGDSRSLKATEVVATLDAPIRPGKTVVWCASFLSAWKTLETDLAREPISLQGSPQVAASLSAAAGSFETRPGTV